MTYLVIVVWISSCLKRRKLRLEILNELYPFSSLKGGANVLISPDLTSANIAYKLLTRLGGATAVGPMLMGIRKPVYLLVPGNDVSDIVNITAMAVFEAQRSHPETRTVTPKVSNEIVMNTNFTS